MTGLSVKVINKIKKWGILGMLLACILCCVYSLAQNGTDGSKDTDSWQHQAGIFLSHQMEQAFFQISRYLEMGEGGINTLRKVEQLMLKQFALYDYVISHEGEEREPEDAMMAELVGRKEGVDEDYKNIDEAHLDYGDDALHIENSILEEMEKENSVHNTQEEKDTEENTGTENADTEDIQEGEEWSGTFEEAVYPAYTYDWSEKWDYESLVSNFYAVDQSTRLREEYVGLEQLLYQDLSVNKEAEGPQILIYHTHSKEAFVDSTPGDSSTTIVGAGDKLAALLQDKYGFRVLHHKGEYDSERDDAYNKSLPAITKILEENPTIEVVIDLHRDAVAGDRKLVMDLQGRPTARFMFFNGLSFGRKNGEITYLENPFIQDNLAFSFQAQVAANEYYPGIARKVYLKAYRYNMHLRPKSMLIELGAQNNTVEEIMNACDPLAHILAIVLG